MYDTIREVQLVQLEAMKKLHKICIDNDIKYVMLAGTLLGAVRHKGFIPWDDDLDIAMTRSEYNKLLSILKNNPIEGYFLQTYDTEKHYVQPYAKLRKDNTKFVERFFADVNMHTGIFVDIFPMDKIPSPNSKPAKLRMLLSRMLTFAIWRKERCHVQRKGIKKLEAPISYLVGLLPKKTLIWLQKLLVERENCNWDYVASMLDSNYPLRKTSYLLSEFEDVVLMDFEDAQFYAPRNWDAVLRRLYGDYMVLPPENKRNSGHEVLEYRF